MNVTRDVISDLWPVVAAGEASADTQALVDEFLQQDPAFARLLQDQGGTQMLHLIAPPPLPPDHEAQAFQRTKRLLYGYDWLLFFAILFSSFAFGRIVSDTSWDVSPVNFLITAGIAACFWVAFFVRMVWVRRRFSQKRGDQ